MIPSSIGVLPGQHTRKFQTATDPSVHSGLCRDAITNARGGLGY